MKRELGIARCGLACCLCSENTKCTGCGSDGCPDNDWCENKKCSIENGITHCYLCEKDCKKGILTKIKPYAFTLFAKRYGEEQLLDCLEENEKTNNQFQKQRKHWSFGKNYLRKKIKMKNKKLGKMKKKQETKCGK